MTALLIAGATGLVGGHALRQALDDARIARVVAPTRRALPAHPKLDNPLVDYARLPADARWWRVDAVVCALGTTIGDAGSQAAFRTVDVDYVLAVARLAHAAGARAFALNSSLGADPASRSFYLRCKGEADAAVQAVGYASVTLVRPSIIGGARPRPRPMEALATTALRAIEPLVPRRYRVVPAERIAAALIDAAVDGRPGVTVIESAALHSV